MGFLTNPPDRNLDQAGMAAGHGQAAPSTKNQLGETRKVSNEESGVDVDESDAILLAMGYKPEMARNRSTLQVAFMSFVLASIPYGLATTFYYPLVGGGPANIIWGWIMVSLIIICVAASLGEITSVYPTAGGVYYQTFMLAPAKYKRVLSWICGWAYVVGNITITLAVNFGSALFIISCVNVFESSPGAGIWDASNWETFLVFVAITLFCNLVSSLGNRWLALVDTFAIFWTLAGVLAILITTLVMAKGGRHSGKYVFTDFEPQSGWPRGWSFCVGLLQAAYATSSTGMIISMCEEVQEPATQVPKAMVATIILNLIAGLMFLLPLLFVIPDLSMLAALASGQPVPTIIATAVGSPGGAIGLLLPLMVLGLICGIGCTTAASRCVWAFSRDGAIPGSKWWKQVNNTTALEGVPLNAMLLSMIVQILLGVIYFGSVAAYNAFSGVGVICLTVSYAMPIATSLFTGRKHVEGAPFALGPLGLFCNIVALAWSCLAVPLFCMPTTVPVTASLMNYASVVFVAFFLIAGAWYFVWGKKNYQGPPTHEDTALETRRSISEARRHSKVA
ncbi:amino acid transporter, partial [Aureobasidium melanogenum]